MNEELQRIFGKMPRADFDLVLAFVKREQEKARLSGWSKAREQAAELVESIYTEWKAAADTDPRGSIDRALAAFEGAPKDIRSMEIPKK